MIVLYYSFSSAPGPLPNRLRMPDGSTRTDPATFTPEEIAAAGYRRAPQKPAHDDAIQAPAEWKNGDWTIRDLTPEEIAARSRKTWPKPAAFLSEFSMPQLAAISLSTDPTIAALRLLLASWAGEVWGDDPRVIAGLDALEAAGIVSAEERATKFAKG